MAGESETSLIKSAVRNRPDQQADYDPNHDLGSGFSAHVDSVRISPEPFKVVEFARRVTENMHDKIAVV
jgi:hypothetical protein